MLKVTAYDWNCPKYITQRFTPQEMMNYMISKNSQLLESLMETTGEVEK
tara:strand:+ start:3746 stop:3892 length:147 start_codon:yes stop_codon:yes gene_type:complete